MKLKNSFKGFTLVEVLIVIIIVGILIAALLPRLTGSQIRARNTARAAAVNQVAQAMGLLITDTGDLALSGQTLGSPSCATLTTADEGATADLGDYLASIPTDPQASHPSSECANGTEWAYYSIDGSQAYIYVSLEGSNQGNATGLIANSAESDYVTALGTDGNFFGVFVRG